MGRPSNEPPFAPHPHLELERLHPHQAAKDEEEDDEIKVGFEDAADAFYVADDVLEVTAEVAQGDWSCGTLDLGCFDVSDCGSLDCGGLDCGF